MCPERGYFPFCLFFSFVPHFALFVRSQVEYIINPRLLRCYHSFKQELQRSGQPVAERLTFHGTTAATIERIVVEGFRVGGVDTPVLAGTALGTGVYSSESPEFAMQCQYQRAAAPAVEPTRRVAGSDGFDRC